MKKIILSVAVAAMALTTTASALEDIKVDGQAKVWYETNNVNDADVFDANGGNSSAEVVFKLGMTGKQGDVGFGAEVTQGSTMGLESVLVDGVRTSANNLDNQDGTGDAYVSKAYFTAPVAPDTIIKMGRQELNTPLAFTEKWNAQQNNFDAAVFVNSSVADLTIIGAFVGQTNTAGSFKATQEFNQMTGGAYALAALYNNKTVAANFWAYNLNDVAGKPAQAVWLDAGMNLGDANVKGYVAVIAPNSDLNLDNTTAVALAADYTVSGIKLFGAVSSVSEDGAVAVANVATGGKKTQLPTAGVYTDGVYVAQMNSTAVKLKAAGKVGSTGLALQAVTNMNDTVGNEALETTEIDLIVSQKVGAFNLKGILMHRMFEDTATDDTKGGQHVRVIASVNF